MNHRVQAHYWSAIGEVLQRSRGKFVGVSAVDRAQRGQQRSHSPTDDKLGHSNGPIYRRSRLTDQAVDTCKAPSLRDEVCFLEHRLALACLVSFQLGSRNGAQPELSLS